MARLVRVFIIIVFVLALLLVAGVLYLRTSLPRLRGTVRLEGVSAPVEVIRDRGAVPHIYAQSREDAVFALGFVHAQDRLWQLEFQRRLGAGRLSEIVGEAALSTDRFLRTLSVYHYAEQTLPNLEPETRALIDAYVAGVNAYLASRRGPLPPEFLILRFEPEPFTAADVLVWAKMMAWDLGGNWDDELLRARLLGRLERERVLELWPPYPADAPVGPAPMAAARTDAAPEDGMPAAGSGDPTLAALYAQLPLDELWAVAPKPLPPGAGSNNWAVAGSRTVSGKPLLANDPHLGLGVPSLWYLAHLSAPGSNVIGGTLPGTPLVLLGRNDRIAWGFTNTNPDVQDLFLERVDPTDPGRYLTPDGSEPFTVRREVIRVKNGDPVEITVRETRHGPVISDVVGSAGEGIAAMLGAGGVEEAGEVVLALQWTTLRDDDLTVQAVAKMNVADSWESFTAALRDFHSAQQNIVYADVDGNIGYYAPGRVPIRAGGDGLFPVPGWTGEFDWVGFVPFEELPQAFNPESGLLMTANHKIVPDDYPYFVSRDWSEPYRAERILELLLQLERHSVESFARIQADQRSLMALEFLPLLLSVEPDTPPGREALARLLSWDGEMAADQPEPLIFSAWYRAFSRLVYADELGELFDDAWGFRPLFLRQVLAEDRRWCDDVRTPAEESCELLAARALREALADLNERYGTDQDRWAWGAAHPALMDHAVFTNTPLARLFDLSIANGGDAYTVDAARYAIDDADGDFTQTSGPAFRAVYDLSDLENSRFIQATGQSGNPLSLHYRDLLEPWRDVSYLPMITRREAVLRGHIGRFTIAPK